MTKEDLQNMAKAQCAVSLFTALVGATLMATFFFVGSTAVEYFASSANPQRVEQILPIMWISAIVGLGIPVLALCGYYHYKNQYAALYAKKHMQEPGTK